MAKEGRVLLRVSCPKWSLVLLGIVGSLSLLLFMPIFILATIHWSRTGFTVTRFLICAVLLVIPVIYLWMIRHAYCWITATEAGLQARRMFGPKLMFSWNEIVRVSRPRLGIAGGAVYIFSKGGQTLSLLREMEGYSQLLDLIESRAPNLSPKQIPHDLWPKKRDIWKEFLGTFLVLLGLIVVYGIHRRFFDF